MFLHIGQVNNSDHNLDTLCACSCRQVRLTEISSQIWLVYTHRILKEISELGIQFLFTNCLSEDNGILKERRKCECTWNLLDLYPISSIKYMQINLLIFILWWWRHTGTILWWNQRIKPKVKIIEHLRTWKKIGAPWDWSFISKYITC